jgi:hypothetical protein
MYPRALGNSASCNRSSDQGENRKCHAAVTPMLPKRDAAQMYPPGRATRGKNVLRVLPAPLAGGRTRCGRPEKRRGAAAS